MQYTINITVLNEILGDTTTYQSIDTVTNQDEVAKYSIKFLNSLDLHGIPPHVLTLQFGTPIILLRNINPLRLCNGTRLSMKKLMNNIIEAKILNEKFIGKDVLLPRIQIIPTDMPLEFKLRSFRCDSPLQRPSTKHNDNRYNITSQNNSPISNYGGGFRCKSEYPWCIIEFKFLRNLSKTRKCARIAAPSDIVWSDISSFLNDDMSKIAIYTLIFKGRHQIKEKLGLVFKNVTVETPSIPHDTNNESDTSFNSTNDEENLSKKKKKI
ncbi:ATP-dependent DNA helicase [Aphis craccivora]|uniref:ATP-dependent DNA helicase n=1 Tax=Aphis craccivora TaxID=307492 RepID=A0A6G0WYF9_APHCR|nr:ATP-dependent DNA helicase [Aphis craccivora]